MSTQKTLQSDSEAEARHPNSAGAAPDGPAQCSSNVALDNNLSEDAALSLLKRTELSSETIEQLSKHTSLKNSRKVRVALAGHPHSPRHVSLPIARQLYIFDLMKVALLPAVPTDLKIAIEDILISRLNAVTTGERLALARRASGRIAAALLDVENSTRKISPEPPTNAPSKKAGAAPRENRVMLAALQNARLTEALVIKSVLRLAASPALIDAVATHKRWSRSREVRTALLRTEHLSLARALEFSKDFKARTLQELLKGSRLPEPLKKQLLRENPRQGSR